MKKILFLIIFSCGYLSAQTTSIPDSEFEQELINQGIDTDGEVNGQVLTSDIENITSLTIEGNYPYIQELTGIEGFSNLQHLVVNWTEITELDLSQNTQLITLDCGSNLLTSIDVSSNPQLEELYCGNLEVDLGPFNVIEEIDVSSNPNIHTLYAQNMGPQVIDIRNGNNNSNMFIDFRIDIMDSPPDEPFGDVCILVDDTEAAQNNQSPYSNWEFSNSYMDYHFVNQCNLSINSTESLSFSIHPNPVVDILHIEFAGAVVEKVILFDTMGRKVLEESGIRQISVSHLSKGSYILKIFSNKAVQTEKIIIGR